MPSIIHQQNTVKEFKYLYNVMPLEFLNLEVTTSETSNRLNMLTELPVPPTTTVTPDDNHNEIVENPGPPYKRINGLHRDVIVPEEVSNNSLSMHSPPSVIKTGGSAEDIPSDLISAKAAVGEQSEDDETIQEYLKRSDTAVIYPEPVGRPESGKQTSIPCVTPQGEYVLLRRIK